MSIQVPDDLEPFVAERVTNGAYPSHGDVIRAALCLLEDRERLVQQIDEGFKQLRSGQSTEYRPESQSTFLANVRGHSANLLSARPY